MNNFTYYNDEWNPPIVEGTSQPLPAPPSPASPANGEFPNNRIKTKKCLNQKILPNKRGGYV